MNNTVLHLPNGDFEVLPLADERLAQGAARGYTERVEQRGMDGEAGRVPALPFFLNNEKRNNMSQNPIHRAILVAGATTVLNPSELIELGEVIDPALLEAGLMADAVAVRSAGADDREAQFKMVVELLKEHFPEAVVPTNGS